MIAVGRGLGIGQKQWAVLLGEKGLEKKRCGDLVDVLRAPEAVRGGVPVAVGIQDGVGFACGEAFIQEVVNQPGMFGEQRMRKVDRFLRLGAGCAVPMERIADYEGGDVIFADKAAEALEVCAECGAVQGEERLGKQIQRIGDSKTDPPISDVKRKDPARVHEPEFTFKFLPRVHAQDG